MELILRKILILVINMQNFIQNARNDSVKNCDMILENI